MPPGPRPKPTALRLLDGGHPERVNRHEPQPEASPPELPAGVAEDVAAIFTATLAELVVMGIARRADTDSLLCYAEAVANHRKASALIARSQILVKGVMGNLVRNPALAIQRDSAMLIRGFAQEFGLTPSARSRIEVKTDAPAERNPFAGPGA